MIIIFFLFICFFSSTSYAIPINPQVTGSADLIKIEKQNRKLFLLQDNKVVKEYNVALGFEPQGRKTCQGDGRTPEGEYTILGRNPGSAFYKSLRVSYPNILDRKRAKSQGCSPGGDIMIHGIGKKMGWIGKNHLANDWTLGCIAVTNEEIDEIWKLVRDGTKVIILP